MRNLIVVFLLLLSTLTNAQSNELALINQSDYELTMSVQDVKVELNLNLSSNPIPNSLRNNYNNELGAGLLIAGAFFIVGALLTQPDYYGMYGPNKPFFEQGPRMIAIIGGGVLFTGGIVLTIQ